MSGGHSSKSKQAEAATIDVSAIASKIAQDPTLLAAVQQRCSELVGESSGYIESLPSAVQRRIKALKNLQLEYTNIEQEFFAEVAALEAKFAVKYKPLLEKRSDIVAGRYEPTDKECEWKDDSDDDDDEEEEEEEEEDDDDGEVNKKAKGLESTSDKAAAKTASSEDTGTSDDQVKGIPSFWLTIFRNIEMMEDTVKEHDEPLLNHLEDIKVVYADNKGLDFTLEFHFSDNEYITNKVLTKTYVVECKVDENDPFSFNGPNIVKATGCKIDWKKGKNLTVKTVKKKQRHKGRGQTRTVTKTVPNESFFNFFSPPEPPTDNSADDDDGDEDTMAEVLAADFARGEYLKDRVIPQAVLFFTGEALEDVDDDDDLEEDEDEALEGDDDDYDEDQDPDFDPVKVPQGQKPPECKQQ